MADGLTIRFQDDTLPGARRCSGCTLCCRLLPVKGMDKAANVRCKHQRTGKGCAVYQTSKMPAECGLWVCRWLTNDDTADLGRPDRTHYVIDVMPDFVTARDGADGEPIKIAAIQVWVDPKYPDAHRDPALRRYLERRGEEGVVAIIRYDNGAGFTLVPPNVAGDGQWHEIPSAVEQEHSLEQLFDMDKAYLCAEPLPKSGGVT